MLDFRKTCSKCAKAIGNKNVTGLCNGCWIEVVNKRALARRPVPKPCVKCGVMTKGGGKTGRCLPCAREMDGRTATGPRQQVADFTLPNVLSAVSQCSGIPAWLLIGPDRRKHLCEARFAAFFVAHKGGHSFSKIGRYFGRDHSTVTHGYRTAIARMGLDGDFELLTTQSRAKALELAEMATRKAISVVKRHLPEDVSA